MDAGHTQWIGNDKSASRRLSRRVAGFRRGEGVSQAQSGGGGRKGCASLLLLMPVDSATAHVANGIAAEGHVRNGEQTAAGDRPAEIHPAQGVLEARLRARRGGREVVHVKADG